MQRRYFSLVELLTVIAVIAILAGILIPAVQSVRAKGKETQAKSQASAIALAIKNYEGQYGLLPVVGSNSPLNDDEYDVLMMFLTKVDTSNAPITIGSDNCDKDKGNIRSVTFLDAPNGFTDTINNTDGEEAGSFRDPWGLRFKVLMDSDYDNEVTLGSDTLHGKVFVYSCGPDKSDNSGATKKEGEDDVCSWK